MTLARNRRLVEAAIGADGLKRLQQGGWVVLRGDSLSALLDRIEALETANRFLQADRLARMTVADYPDPLPDAMLKLEIRPGPPPTRGPRRR